MHSRSWLGGIETEIFWLAHQVVGNPEEAKDVTQNVLIRLWKVLPRYDDRYAFKTWLYRMTVNLAIDSLRRSSRHLRDTPLEEVAIAVRPQLHLVSSSLPTRMPSSEEIARIFDELKERLPRQQRLVFTLREIEGMTSEEGRPDPRSHAPLPSETTFSRLGARFRSELRKRYPEYVPHKSAHGGRGMSLRVVAPSQRRASSLILILSSAGRPRSVCFGRTSTGCSRCQSWSSAFDDPSWIFSGMARRTLSGACMGRRHACGANRGRETRAPGRSRFSSAWSGSCSCSSACRRRVDVSRFSS